MRSVGLNLALFVCCLSASAFGTTRHIRSSLDDPEPNQVRVLPESHADFPLTLEPPPSALGRLIRVSLDEGAPIYARLPQLRHSARRFRTTLD